MITKADITTKITSILSELENNQKFTASDANELKRVTDLLVDSVNRDAEDTGTTNVVGNIYMISNAVPTSTPVQGNRYPVEGTSVLGALTRNFLHDAPNNALEFDAETPRLCKIQASLTLLAPVNNVIGSYIAVVRAGDVIDPDNDWFVESSVYTTTGGSRPDSAFVQTFALLNPGDKVYVVVQNTSGANDVTVQFMHLMIDQSAV